MLQLEEQVAGTSTDAEVAELIDDQQRCPAEIPDALPQAAFAIGLGEAIDDIAERREVDAAAGPHGLDAECCRQMRLAGAGLADEVDHLVPIDEVETGERHDSVAIERGLEREVEAGQGLDRRQARHLQRRLDPASLAEGGLLGEQRVDRFDRAELAALELLDDMIERLQRARHAQADQVAADALDRRVRQRLASHDAVATAARRRPTAS
jgi:hypothetical protein